MKKDKRTFFNLPKKVKLWEINSDNIIKTPDPYLISEVDFSKTGTILDIGSSLIRAVSKILGFFEGEFFGRLERVFGCLRWLGNVWGYFSIGFLTLE